MKTGVLDWHDRPIFRTRHMCESHGMPHHQITLGDVPIIRSQFDQSTFAVVHDRKRPCCTLLILRIRRRPQMPFAKRPTLANLGLCGSEQ